MEGRLTAEAFSPAATYGERMDALFAEIAAMGYRGVDLWTAHCDPEWATPQHIDGLLAASDRHKVELVSLAGGMGGSLERFEALCRLSRDIGCPVLGIGGNLIPDQIEEVSGILERYGVKLGFENHPNEPTPAVVLEKIGNGRFPRIGSTLDTGWFGTHDYPVVKAIDELKDYLFLVHLKNVEKPCAHVAATWEDGCLDMEPIVRRLREVGYAGWMSVEFEPEEGDPTEACRRFRELAEKWWASAE